ncbi:MAG: FKBP-type peptidyl-prolyl cis-trans isomerase [Sulfuritalea sp.]|nr:FKBP-type peptidyl-prolyl cis-trans isomerase [Sulfuritalea sp.]
MSMQIEDGSRVTLRCRVTDSAGAVLDEGSKPLVFVCGRQQVIAGLEARLRGREPGYRGRIDLAPEAAYGPYRQELVFEAVRENLPADMDIQPGMLLSPGGSDGKFQLKVVSLTERGAMLDGNHHYAGKHLIFEVEVLMVEPGVEPGTEPGNAYA